MTGGSALLRVPGFVVLAIALISVSGAASEEVGRPALQVTQPLSVAGMEELSIDQGAVHYRGETLPSTFSLEAEEVSLHLEWRNGSAAGPPGNEQFVVVQDGRDRSTDRFSDVTIRLGSPGPAPEIVAFPDGASPAVQATGTGDHRHGDVSERYLTRVGQSPETESEDGDRPLGFWYQPSEDWIVARGLDEARTTGNFSLFVNNATVVVEQGGDVVWRNWTGYREDTRGPGATTFQRQLLEIRVRGGVSTIEADDRVHTYGAVLEGHPDGVVSAPEATGRLEMASSSFSFEQDPLRMEGEGSFRISKPSDPSRLDPGLRMDVSPSSAFLVRGGERIETTAGDGAFRGLGLEMLGVLGAAGVLLAAGRSGLARELEDRWRSSRYAKWMARGREISGSRDHGAAALCFRRAAKAQPAKGVAWYQLAISLLEDGRPKEVLHVVDEAREGEAIIDELDFLEVEAGAARQIGDDERCREAVQQLAEGSEAMASTLVRDLALDEDVLGEELAGRLSGPGGDEEGLPGYV